MKRDVFLEALRDAYSFGISHGHPLGHGDREKALAELVTDYAEHLDDGPGDAPSLSKK